VEKKRKKEIPTGIMKKKETEGERKREREREMSKCV